MIRRILLVLTIAGGVAAAIPGGVGAADTTTARFRGHWADPYFSYTDPTGCIVTYVDVIANRGTLQRHREAPEQLSEAAVSIFRFDTCDGDVLVDAQGVAALPAGAFSVDGRLDGAQLRATVPVWDLVGDTTSDVEIELAWTPDRPIEQLTNNFSYHSRGVMVNAHVNGPHRRATATGHVVYRDEDYTPQASVLGEIGWANNGYVEITRV